MKMIRTNNRQQGESSADLNQIESDDYESEPVEVPTAVYDVFPRLRGIHRQNNVANFVLSKKQITSKDKRNAPCLLYYLEKEIVNTLFRVVSPPSEYFNI